MLTAQKLRAIRALTGFTQAELATKSGISANAIAEFELGKRELRTGSVLKLMAALDVKVKWIVGDVEISGP